MPSRGQRASGEVDADEIPSDRGAIRKNRGRDPERSQDSEGTRSFQNLPAADHQIFHGVVPPVKARRASIDQAAPLTFSFTTDKSIEFIPLYGRAVKGHVRARSRGR